MVSSALDGSGLRFWFRWSWRDMRHHWISIIAIALVLAIGTGVYAGLTSTSTWRRMSNDASFASTHMHDLRVAANPGTFTEQGTFVDLVSGLEHAASIEKVDERLVVDSQIELDTDEGVQLFNARIVGGSLDTGAVDAVWVREGRTPMEGTSDAVLEAKFADFHGIEPPGTLRLADGGTITFIGLGVAPEDFYVSGPEGSILAEADLATIYVERSTAQDIAGRPGAVNDAVITLVPGTDRDVVENELTAAAGALPSISLEVTNQDEAEAFRILYEDIDNDQWFFTLLAALIGAAAFLAAFNLVSRIVEAQRREVGIGMALGAPARHLAIRPLLVGVQIGILGVAAGIGVGLLVGWAMGGLLESLLPLPDYETPFQFGVFAAVATLGFVVPVLASAWPVWRATHVEPIEAIRSGHLTARPGRFTNLSKRIRLPGTSINQIPLRNVLRTPRRTLLTSLAVGAAVALLVTVSGMLDSFARTVDRGSSEATRGDPDRVLVLLDTFYAADSPEVRAIEARDEVDAVDAGLRLPAMALDANGDDAFDLVIDAIDFESARWTPTIAGGDESPIAGGIVLAEKAAADLDVGPGDTVLVRHPAVSASGFGLVVTEFTVLGTHPNPARPFSFVDVATTPFGLEGSTNMLSTHPADGVTRTELQVVLFSMEGIASTTAVARVGEAFDEALEAFVGFLVISAVAVLALALLVAFNATRITVDERQRDHATMRAFGLPVRGVVGTLMKESLIIGALATLLGLAIGTVLLDWMLRSLAERTLPDFGIALHIAPTTVALAMAIGIGAVSIAPLFQVRRLRSMDIPSALRVME